MKIQFDIGSGNKQTSNDDETTQIQIGRLPVLCVVIFVVAILLWIII